jgi:hypothetical protein
MEGLLGNIPLGSLTPAGLLAIVVLLIAFGRLVPRRTLEDMIHDRNEWRTAHRISEQARMELQQQVEELLEHARTSNAFIRSSLPPVPGYPPPPVNRGDSEGQERPHD